MLTVKFDRLGLQSGDRFLDLGAGLGRHTFEARRRGAQVVALDRSLNDKKYILPGLGDFGDRLFKT